MRRRSKGDSDPPLPRLGVDLSEGRGVPCRWAESDVSPTLRRKRRAPSRNFKKDMLTREQAKRLLKEAQEVSTQEKHDYAILSLMFRTGLRDIEVVRADVGDIKPHSGVMALYVHGKGRSEKDDFVALTEALQADIDRYLAEKKTSPPPIPSSHPPRTATRAVASPRVPPPAS